MSNRSWKRIVLGIIFLLLSIFYTGLFFQKANFDNTMIFNIAHLKSLSNIFTSPINFNYWNHSGSLINLFSPWLTILPGWAFVSLNPTYGFAAYLLVITFLTLVSGYYYMNKFSKDTFESLLFTVVYTFSLNRFYLVFQQQRLENYLVLIFLPMVYYGAYQFFKTKDWKLLVWGLALTLWTSPYMFLAVCLTLVPPFILIIFSKLSHNFKYWKKLGLNSLLVLVMTVLTTIGFIGPLGFIQSKQQLTQAPIKNIDYVTWFKKLGFSMTQQYLLWGIVSLSVLLLMVIFIKSRFSYKVMMIEMIPLTYLVLFKVSLTNLDISRLVPNLQSILDLFVIIIASRIVIMVFQEGPGMLKMILLTAAIIGSMFMVYNQTTQIKTTKTLATSKKVNYQKVVYDYHDHATNGQNRILINNRKTAVSFYTKTNDYWVQYYDPQSTTMDLPIQKYDGYNIQLNNEKVFTKISPRKTLQLQTNPGKNIIEIHVRYDWVGIVSLLINLFGFILLGYLSLKNLQWKKKKLPENG